jgi:hypothetical protein
MAELVTWKPGQDVLYRFRRLDGSLGAVHPARVVEDDGERLLCWVLAGTTIRMTTAPDGRPPRDLPLEQRFRAARVPRRGTWRTHSTLRLVFERQWASVWWFFEPDGTFRDWYVNLEVPLGRDSAGFDRADGVLDLEVRPDLRWSWKDEDEAVAAVAAGRFDPVQMRQLRAEGERWIALAESGRFPFDGTYCDAVPEPSWTLPELPLDLLDP